MQALFQDFTHVPDMHCYVPASANTQITRFDRDFRVLMNSSRDQGYFAMEM